VDSIAQRCNGSKYLARPNCSKQHLLTFCGHLCKLHPPAYQHVDAPGGLVLVEKVSALLNVMQPRRTPNSVKRLSLKAAKEGAGSQV
jgi:hypothetical protein